MVDMFSCLSWLFFNVGVPAFAPVTLLPLLGFSRHYRGVVHDIARRSIQNGQLFWVVISMCASACYEIGCAVGDASTRGTLALMLAGLLWHVLFIVLASVLVCLGAADAADPISLPANDECDDRLVWFSLIITAVISISFSLSHYSLT